VYLRKYTRTGTSNAKMNTYSKTTTAPKPDSIMVLDPRIGMYSRSNMVTALVEAMRASMNPITDMYRIVPLSSWHVTKQCDSAWAGDEPRDVDADVATQANAFSFALVLSFWNKHRERICVMSGATEGSTDLVPWDLIDNIRASSTPEGLYTAVRAMVGVVEAHEKSAVGDA